MKSDPIAYTVPAELMQAIVSTLNTMPAGQVRALLNAIEAECVRQDQMREAARRMRESVGAQPTAPAAMLTDSEG